MLGSGSIHLIFALDPLKSAISLVGRMDHSKAEGTREERVIDIFIAAMLFISFYLICLAGEKVWLNQQPKWQTCNWPDYQSSRDYNSNSAGEKSNRKEWLELSLHLFLELFILLCLGLLKHFLKLFRLCVKFLFAIFFDLHSQNLDVEKALLLICLLNHIYTIIINN